MTGQENILVVVDPIQDNSAALERALITAKIRDQKPVLHLFISADSSSAQSKTLHKSGQWLTQLFASVEEQELQYTSELCWSDDWQQAVLSAAGRCDADMIMIPASGELSQKALFSDAKWGVLRKSQCPVLIVREGAKESRKTVLAAVNMQAGSDNYQVLNEKILARGQWMAERYNADFHVVNAYNDSLNYPDKGQLMRRLELAADRLHLQQGSPEDVISSVAKNVQADIVVIGTLARQGVMAAMRGNTSEKLLGKLSQDVMTLN